MNYRKSSEICSRLTERFCGRESKGIVCSVFASTVNLLMSRSRPIVITSGKMLMPHGIQLADAIDFLQIGIQRGDPLCWQKNHLVISDILTVELCGSAVDLRLRKETVSIGIPAAIERALAAYPAAIYGVAPLITALYPEKASTPMEQNHWTNFLRNRMQAFLSALENGSYQEIVQSSAAIAGCGPGLTPSSDDFVCGLIAALFLLRPFSRAAELAATITSGMLIHTTIISATHLEDAAKGLFSSAVINFSKTLDRPSSQSFDLALQQILEYGSTSGADFLTGFWFGLIQGNK